MIDAPWPAITTPKHRGADSAALAASERRWRFQLEEGNSGHRHARVPARQRGAEACPEPGTLSQVEVARVIRLVVDAVESGQGARSRRGGEYDLAGLQRIVAGAWVVVATEVGDK